MSEHGAKGWLPPEEYAFDNLTPVRADWGGAVRGHSSWDNIGFHVDLGAGRVKKGRFAIDRFPDDGIDHVQDFDLDPNLPFADGSIQSIISHHMFEHLADGFVPLMDECHRVLKPGGVLRVIVPLFPSHSAVADPDHKRYFMEGTFKMFGGTREGDHWAESFSTPYTSARFEIVDEDITARSTNPSIWWTEEDRRELRVALRKWQT